jgi:AraC-like DNA-binding protein
MQSGSKRALFEHVKYDRDTGILFRDVTAPSLSYPWHFHPELELTHIVRGSGHRHVADSIEAFEEGDLCLIGSDTPHCWLTERGGQASVHARVIQFLPNSLGLPLDQHRTLRPLAELVARARRGLCVHGKVRERAAGAMQELFTHRTRPLDRYVGLLGILTELSQSDGCRVLGLTDPEQPSDERATRAAGKLLAFIHEHAADPALSFQSVARAAGMSRASLGRAFPRLFGKTFARYLSEIRVARACALLADSEQGVAEIAVLTGFGSISNFNRRFLELKGTTPLRYRKASQKRSA